MGLADRSWPLLRRLMGAHGLIYRATGGLIGHRFPGAPPMLLVDHVGAKSGTVRVQQRSRSRGRKAPTAMVAA
jgi:F420H(2)-dependent quinone reductase